MVPSPWERRSFLRGMRQGGAVARRMSSGNQVRVGQYGATSRTCSSSFLTLHSVCASRLTGGNTYLRKARGQLCASISVPRALGQGEYSWQWEDSREANRSTWVSPNWLQISRIVSGWSRHSLGNVSCRESASAARLSSPGMWTARSDLSSVLLQRRRWRASCDMRRDRIPPNRLMYETAAVLSVWTNTCLPNSSGRNCRKARCTANSSRQLMCQSSRGPVQSPEAACPSHVAPQPVLEASVVTTTCRDTCSKGTLVRRKQGPSRGWRSGDTPVWCSPEVYRGAMPISGLRSATSAEVVSYEATRAAWLQLRMPYAPGASESVSVVPPSCLWGNSGRPAWTGHTRWWDVPPHSPSLTPYWENSFSAQGRACSFPSWPEAPTGWGARAPGPCDRTTVLMRRPCSRQLRILMPTSRNGARAASATFVKTRGDRESPKGRTLYCHARPSDANRRNGLYRGRIKTWK